MEQLGRKYGYNLEDADGNYCPVAKEAVDADTPAVRGFGKGYEDFPENLYTPIDCAKLIDYLKETGVKDVVPSLDAGLYLCEFINYCSLAEAKRTASHGHKNTPVLFIHIPPVDEPLSTEDATEAFKKVISWVCSQ